MSDARERAQDEAERRWPIQSKPSPWESLDFSRREVDAYAASAFVAGAMWAKADLPDRETIAKTLYEANWDDLLTWDDDKEHWLKQADAVLALFRGEEPK